MAVPLPSPTLFITNLETKTKKIELRSQLYALFTPFGKVIDVVAKKHGGGRGQAFVVFEEQAAATAALRGLHGEPFYSKELRISYAKKPSHATLSRTDPSASKEAAALAAARLVVSNAQGEYEQLEKERLVAEEDAIKGGKRDLEEKNGDGDGPASKKLKMGEDEDDMEVEMEMEDDEESSGTQLICSNLPPECTSEIISALFSQYPGFQSSKSASSSQIPTSHPKSNPGAKTFVAIFDSSSHAQTAVDATKGFLMQPGWEMSVSVL